MCPRGVYSTAIRRGELGQLKLTDLDQNNAILNIHQGKGKKDRMVPMGKTAIEWTQRYIEQIRPQLLVSHNEQTLFLNTYGCPFQLDGLTRMVNRYMKLANIDKTGSCHLLRHSCATHMLNNGADVRFIQQLLGHSSLNSTQIYTHVAIKKLQEIHQNTHPRV